MADPATIRIIKHVAVPLCGSFEVRFPNGRQSQFYRDDIPGRRLRPDLIDSDTAKKAAQSLARAEQGELDWRSAMLSGSNIGIVPLRSAVLIIPILPLPSQYPFGEIAAGQARQPSLLSGVGEKIGRSAA